MGKSKKKPAKTCLSHILSTKKTFIIMNYLIYIYIYIKFKYLNTITEHIIAM